MASESLIKAVVATAELMGNELSIEGGRMFCADLAEFPEDKVLAALTRTRREVSGRLKLADVISRIDDGRPGSEEAWAMLPLSEAETVVWTDEMREAYGVAEPLMETDAIAARMAFKQSYDRLLTESRTQRKPIKWTTTFGHDPLGREQPIKRAVELGRLTSQRAKMLLPHVDFEKSEPLQLPAGSFSETLKKLAAK